MDKLLSIVIPVFKVEDYIVECLESLVVPDKELFNKLEIIVVNDGTPDNSAIMAKEFEKKFPNVFHVIDKENGGHGSAFNVGLSKATGKYLRFLDSDDWFDTDNFVKLLRYLETSDVDLILNPFNYYLIEKKEFIIIPLKSMEYEKIYDIEEYDFIHSGNRANMTVFHSSTYKTKLLKVNVPLFAEGCFYDDMALRIVPIAVSQNFIAFDYPVYNYRVGRVGQSISYENKMKHVADLNKVYACSIQFMKATSLSESNRKRSIKYLFSNMVYYQVEKLSRMKYNDCKEIMGELSYVLKGAENYYDKRKRHMMYEMLPFPVYFYFFRVYDLLFYRNEMYKKDQ